MFLLLLICARRRFALSVACLKALHQVFVHAKAAFDLEYRRKVEYEYVQAMKGGLALMDGMQARREDNQEVGAQRLR